ncbi:MAG: MFS transporter [Betaproteobacteria bacterium]|nr:MAG: MFS transporter [Betaproteobacteria bacterium]
MPRNGLTARYGVVVSRLFESSPLRNRAFRLFYFGSVGAAIGYTMQATIAAWLMATLTPSEFMVALVQTASTAPALLFGLIAGTLADIVDRRRLILVTQIGLFVATLLLGVATLAGVVGPVSLLLLTFVVGAGFTFYLPAQQASINELVPRTELARAVALGAVAFNVARAVGPALAGAVAAWFGSGSALVGSALFFIVMILAIRKHRGRDIALPGVPERLLSGAMSGVRYARHSPAMRSFIVRNLSFAVCASSLWALLPVIARDELSLGAGGYGLLSAGFGAGAVAGALWLPRHLQRLTLNVVTLSGVALWTVALLLVAATRYTGVALVGVFGCGMAWVSVFASLSAGTQSTAPAWVRARAVSMNLVAVQASLAVGSALWGALASAAGVRISLAVSAGALVLLHLVHRRVAVEMGKESDVMPGAQLPELTITGEPLPDDGPVLIQIEYRIDASNRNGFVRAIRRVGPTRRRNGATSWRVYRDLGEEDRYVERYVIASWAEYVRLRSRMTMTDSRLQAQVEQLQRPGVPIRVSRLIGLDMASAEADPANPL